MDPGASGANVVRGLSGVGHRNAEFVEEFLETEGFRIADKHLRGIWPRKPQFFPHSGQVGARKIKEKPAARVFENVYRFAVRLLCCSGVSSCRTASLLPCFLLASVSSACVGPVLSGGSHGSEIASFLSRVRV